MATFDPNSKEHREVVISAMRYADSVGAGRISSAREALEMYDITIGDIDAFHDAIFRWGLAL